MNADTFAAEHNISEATAMVLLNWFDSITLAAEYAVRARDLDRPAQRRLLAELGPVSS